MHYVWELQEGDNYYSPQCDRCIMKRYDRFMYGKDDGNFYMKSSLELADRDIYLHLESRGLNNEKQQHP